MSEIPKFHDKEPDAVTQAEDVVEEHILNQVAGKEGFFTARSAALACGCRTCVDTFNSWVDFMAGPEFVGCYDEYKLTPKDKKHTNANPWISTGLEE